MFIKNWFYLRKDSPGLKKETIEDPTDTYVNIVDVDSPNSGNIISVSNLNLQLKPYKTYTALLSQSGSGTEDSINTGLLTIGVTYFINENSPGMDFTNVGAPNNDLGTYFVATGTTPNSWGEGATYTLAYSAGAPIVTVLENTIGDVYFTYYGEGTYILHSQDLFTNEKTYVLMGQTNTAISITKAYAAASSEIWIEVFTDVNTYGNDLLNYTPFEIRVYN